MEKAENPGKVDIGIGNIVIPKEALTGDDIILLEFSLKETEGGVLQRGTISMFRVVGNDGSGGHRFNAVKIG